MKWISSPEIHFGGGDNSLSGKRKSLSGKRKSLSGTKELIVLGVWGRFVVAALQA